mgnify:CR=1 FL=1
MAAKNLTLVFKGKKVGLKFPFIKLIKIQLRRIVFHCLPVINTEKEHNLMLLIGKAEHDKCPKNRLKLYLGQGEGFVSFFTFANLQA